MTATPDDADDCTVPPPLAKEELHAFVLGMNEHQAREISDYVEWQCNKKRESEMDDNGTSDIEEELVEHAEKIKSERVYGTDYDAWDVHTNQGRWWVITNPTNLYSQTLMPTSSIRIATIAQTSINASPRPSSRS